MDVTKSDQVQPILVVFVAALMFDLLNVTRVFLFCFGGRPETRHTEKATTRTKSSEFFLVKFCSKIKKYSLNVNKSYI